MFLFILLIYSQGFSADPTPTLSQECEHINEYTIEHNNNVC